MNALNRLSFMSHSDAVNRAGKLWPPLAAIVLGVVLARWVWVFLAPVSMAVLPPAEIAANEDAGKIFGSVASSVGGVNMVVLPGVRLVGVFAPIGNSAASTKKNKNGFAVLQLDEKHQTGVALGDEVVAGVKLREIYADHVVLERDGITQLVMLEEFKLDENPTTTFVTRPPAPTADASPADRSNARGNPQAKEFLERYDNPKTGQELMNSSRTY